MISELRKKSSFHSSSVASIASVICAEVWRSSLIAFFLPVLVCIIDDIAYLDLCILQNAHMKIAESVQPGTTWSTGYFWVKLEQDPNSSNYNELKYLQNKKKLLLYTFK